MRHASDHRGGRGARTTAPLDRHELRRRIYATATAEPSWRCWGLYVHVGQLETLDAAYRLAKANHGAPGSAGVTFEAIAASGVDACLQPLRDELVAQTDQPMRLRHQAIPQDGGTTVRVLSMPSIRDRVVQGALKLILEPRCAAAFQPGSDGYRPKRSAQDAVLRVADALVQDQTRVIDVDLQAYVDNVRPHLLLATVAPRGRDPDLLPVLKRILNASGKHGVPHGGVMSPGLSQLSLTEVDRMRERAQEVTRRGPYTDRASARFAEDLVMLVDADPPHAWLLKAGEQRLREELAVLPVTMHAAQRRIVALATGESCGCLGLECRRVRRRTGRWRAYDPPRLRKRTTLLRKLKALCRGYQSQPMARVIALITPIVRGWVRDFAGGDASRCVGLMKDGVEQQVRRQLMRARKRRGFGWKRWRRRWL